MPLFYFQVNDVQRQKKDSVEMNCANLKEACDVAVRELTQILRDDLPDGQCETYLVTVRNASGVPVYVAMATMLGEVLDPAA